MKLIRKYLTVVLITGASLLSSQVNAEIKDSIGVEKKDGKTYVLHKVTSGETLYSIAKKYSVSVDQLKQFNPEAAAGLKVGQIIRVPSKVQTTQAPSAPVAPASMSTHKIVAGETLYSLSKKYGVSVDEIKKANPGLGSSLAVGQEIKIPVKGQSTVPAPAAPATTAATQQPMQSASYTVKSGETMYSIATKYKISVEQLKQLNPGIGSSLAVGQVIKVPATTSVTEEVSDPTLQLTDNTAQPAAPVPAPATAPAPTKPITPVPAPAPAPAPAGPAPGEKQSLPAASVPRPNADYKRVNESGLIMVSAEHSNTKFFYAWHKSAPIGTIIQVTNTQTGKSIFVKVVGKLAEGAGEKVVLKVTQKAWERLEGTGEKFAITLTYLQ